MFSNKTINTIILFVGVFVLIVRFLFIRQQVAITDKQFLRSMISHHGGAILMCEQASLHDPKIKELCQKIIVSQRQEIEQMKALLNH